MEAQFESQFGYWRLPGDLEGDPGVGGTLTQEIGQLPKLSLMGSLDDDPHPLQTRFEEIILGVLEDGRHVTVLGAVGSTGLRQRDSMVYSEEWVAQGAIIGEHFESESDLGFRDVDIELDVLPELVQGGIERVAASEESREWRWQRPQDFEADLDHMSVSLMVLPHGGLVGPGVSELRFWAVPRFRVHSKVLMDLKTILTQAVYPMVDLSSLFAGRPAAIERIEIHRVGTTLGRRRFSDTSMQLLVNPSRRPSDPRNQSRHQSRLSTFSELPMEFSSLLTAWMELWAENDVRTLLDRYFTSLARPSPFPETTFLGLAVFLEGFHKAVFDPVDQPYADRLTELLMSVKPLVDATKAQVDKLVIVIKDTRNTLAHGRRRAGDKTVEGQELKMLNDLVDLLVRGLILSQLGFAVEETEALLKVPVLRVGSQAESTAWCSESE